MHAFINIPILYCVLTEELEAFGSFIQSIISSLLQVASQHSDVQHDILQAIWGWIKSMLTGLKELDGQ
jgi:hypothetical protein